MKKTGNKSLTCCGMAEKINASIFHVYSPKEKVTLSIFSTVIFAVAVPVNLYVLLGYLRSNHRRPSDLLQMNLTLSQFLNALLTIPLQHLMHVMKPELAVDGGTPCQITGILPYPFYIITIETMVFMSVDKLKAVKSPLRYAAKMTKKRMRYIVLFTWVHAVIFAIILVAFIEVGYNQTRGDCAIVGENQNVVSAVIGVTHVAIPFVLLLVFYCKLMKYLRRHNRQMLRLATTQAQQGRRRNMFNRGKWLRLLTYVGHSTDPSEVIHLEGNSAISCTYQPCKQRFKAALGNRESRA